MQTKSTVTAEPAGSGRPPDAAPRSRARITRGRMILAVAIPVLFSGLTAQAQQPASDPKTSWSLSITPAHQFSANLDAGGDVQVSRVSLAASAMRQIDPDLQVGMNLSYQFDDWKFGNPAAFGNVAPWTEIQRAGVGLKIGYAVNDNWQLSLAPSVQWAGESGAKWADALTYGAVVAATRTFRTGLTLGMGAAVFHDLDETTFYPYLAVSWNITDRLKLSNPPGAGPAGPGGLELSYALNNGRELGFGAAYRRYRFRLDKNGPSLGGIGEADSIPIFFRVSQSLDKSARIDLYAGAMMAGKLSVEYPNGGGKIFEDYGTAPFVGITFGARF